MTLDLVPDGGGSPKRIVYLWGAGATQAEVSYRGARPLNLLMQDSDLGSGVATRILQKLHEPWRSQFSTDHGMDIEKLISLLSASGRKEHSALADQIRTFYFEDIRNQLVEARVLDSPALARALLTLHAHDTFKQSEVLAGVLTTNHDGLLQRASQQVYGEVNLGVPFASVDVTIGGGASPILIQLHGSFTWAFGLPITVALLHPTSTHSENTAWIPPAVLKESKSYPFNKLSGLAYELLSRSCDVLRVVGASLTQNDWNILSMLFNAQRHNELLSQPPFRIELILPERGCQEIVRSCSYLRNVIPISQLSDGDFSSYSDESMATDEMKNPLFYWLKQKIQFHRRNGELGTGPLPTVINDVAGGIP